MGIIDSGYDAVFRSGGAQRFDDPRRKTIDACLAGTVTNYSIGCLHAGQPLPSMAGEICLLPRQWWFRSSLSDTSYQCC